MTSAMRRTLLIVAAGLLLVPTAAEAAIFDFSVTYRKAFDQMVDQANSTTAASLRKQHADLLALQRKEVDWDDKINALRYSNEERLREARKQVTLVHGQRVARLEDDVKRTKARYEPVFRLHDALNAQLKAAQKLKSKQEVAILKPQAEAAKAATKLAKLDIRKKEDALKAGKAARTAKMKEIRGVLAETDKLKTRIKAARSKASGERKLFGAETKALNRLVKNGDAAGTAQCFGRALGHLRVILQQKEQIYAHEQSIASVIAKAEAQIRAAM